MTHSIGQPGVKSTPLEQFPARVTAAESSKKYREAKGRESLREREREQRITANSVRRFIAWDGEGVNTKGPGKPQSYVLFGNSLGSKVLRRDGSTLNFIDCAELILSTGSSYPNDWNIGFAFDYDVNQIVRTLPYGCLEHLNKRGQVKYGDYWIRWRKGKSFTISRIAKSSSTQRTTVTIYDIFSFFGCSFVKALSGMLSESSSQNEHIEFVARGKDRRKDFTLDELDTEVIPYWSAEIALLETLASSFRDLMYAADLPITQWYGPGAISSLVLNRVGIKSHMDVPPDPVGVAAQYAYAAGRFERFHGGRSDGPIWGCDINSAYPAALAQLPSLSGGVWRHSAETKPFTEIDREDIRPFGLYQVELSHPQWRQPWYPNTPPGPLFFRTPTGEMRYPWHLTGWYWGPEVENLCHPRIAPHAQLLQAWHFTPVSDVKPFAFIKDMYETRRQWKAEGRQEQLVLKLAMNSIYGKLAQRVGWEQSGKAPKFHQLEWAGWITSYTRAQIFRTLWQLGNEILAVETDGIYTTRDPGTIGIVHSEELGGWSISEYNEFIYIQSGTYFARTGEAWATKYRGLDPKSLSLANAVSYFQQIGAGQEWPSLHCTTTRYIGLAAAMMQAAGDPGRFRGRHGVWEQEKDKDLSPGAGKRCHHVASCVECAEGVSPGVRAHYLALTMDLMPGGETHSTRHYIPWKDGPKKDFNWRLEAEEEHAKLFER